MPMTRGSRHARTCSLANAPLWVALLFGIQLVSVGPVDDVQPSAVNTALGNFDWQSAPARYGDHAAVEHGWTALTSSLRTAVRLLPNDGAADWLHGTTKLALPGGRNLALAARTALDAARSGRDSFHSTAVPPPAL